jgi:hypothetical protein
MEYVVMEGTANMYTFSMSPTAQLSPLVALLRQYLAAETCGRDMHEQGNFIHSVSLIGWKPSSNFAVVRG